jgi:hypothetical protein
MRLFVYMFGSHRRILRTSIGISTATGIAIEFFGAPPALIFVVPYCSLALLAITQNWMRRHPDLR